MRKYIIGYSDYTREQIEKNETGGAIGSRIAMLMSITNAEKNGFKVKFISSIFTRIFCMAKYKIVAVKPLAVTPEYEPIE